jgi:putative salt-induced outer membrane protein YdiY
MASKTSFPFLLVLALSGLAALQLQAQVTQPHVIVVPIKPDVIETKDGSRIVGKLTKIEGGNVYVETTYAGNLIIKQSEVVGIDTDRPVALRFEGGAVYTGVLSENRGVQQVAGAGWPVVVKVDKIAALWPGSGEDPAMAALEHHWKFEAEADLNGESGNQNQLGTEAGLKATYANSVDALHLYTSYNRQVTNSEESADQFKIGADYANNFRDGESWYVKDEAGFDRIMGISEYDIAALGFGYDLIKNKLDTLTARAGLAYVFDEYTDSVTPEENSLGADFELNHTLAFPNWKLINHIAFNPTFDDFKNISIEQESAFEIPLTAPGWKLRTGVTNNYNSKPGEGLQKLDTTYFTRLILSL